MAYLLDTHTLLWFENGNKLLSKNVKNIIVNSPDKKYISIASLWEIAIKVNLSKLQLHISFKELIKEIEKNNFIILPVETKHLFILSELKLHHNDPFDRIIISQAKSENLIILTKDTLFKKYKISLLWN